MRMRLVPIVLAAGTLLAAVPMPASAATHSVLTNGKVGGSNVKVGAILHANLIGKATLIIPRTSAGIRCSQAGVTDKVLRNPRKPGTAVESLIAQTFGKCSTNIPGTKGVRSIKVLRLPYRTTISDSKGFPVTLFRPSTRVTLNTVVGALTCTYGALKLKGNASNKGQTISFKNQRFTRTSGSAACPKAGNFSATFGPVVNISLKKHPRVFVN